MSRIFSEEHRNKLSIAHKGRTYEEKYGGERAIKIRKKMSLIQKKREHHPHTEETKRKITLSKLGKSSIFKEKNYEERYGKERALEIKKKIKESQIGRCPWNKGLIGYGKGKKQTEETKRKLSISHKGKVMSKEHIKHLSESHEGNIPSLENREKRSVTMKKYIKNNYNNVLERNRKTHMGEKSHLWKGGKSFELYSLDWTKTLKQSIRERDNYICKTCGNIQTKQLYDVHHIDYDKKNCNPINLITLCRYCHVKTNTNRNKWEKYFKKLMGVSSYV